jgi:hypothetical protein
MFEQIADILEDIVRLIEVVDPTDSDVILDKIDDLRSSNRKFIRAVDKLKGTGKIDE